ncbi:hypothetical protein D3C77_587700 [compost metagenome]
MLGNQAFPGASSEHCRRHFYGIKLTVPGRVAQIIEQLAQGGQYSITAISIDQGLAGGMTKQGVDGRQAIRELGKIRGH